MSEDDPQPKPKSAAIDLLKKVLVPSDILGVIRLVVGVLALLALIKHAMQSTFAGTLEMLVVSYENAIATIFAPLQPVAQSLTDLITSLTSLSLDLDNTWRYIFLLFGIYFFARVRTAIGFRHWGTALFRLLWGGLMALVASVLIASAQISTGSFYENFALSTMCVAGIVIYELGVNVWYASVMREHQAQVHGRPVRGWGAEFLKLTESDLARAMVAVILAALMVYLIPGRGPKSAGITAFAVVMLLYGLFWVYWASRQEGALSVLVLGHARNSDADVGFSILGIYFWTLVLVAVDTGVRIMSG